VGWIDDGFSRFDANFTHKPAFYSKAFVVSQAKKYPCRFVMRTLLYACFPNIMRMAGHWTKFRVGGVKKHFWILALVFWTIIGGEGTLQAQVATVKDAQTGRPLESITFSSIWPSTFATTNSNGQADISTFKGAEKIEISGLGYTAQYWSFLEIERNQFEIDLEPSVARLEEIVVSATRWSQLSRSTPSRIAKVSQKEIALLNPQTAADMLGASGEVFIQKSQQGGGSPMIRGFAANRLLYAVDGVRMNSAIFRSGNVHNVISLDPLAMEGAEVLFGPASTIYGSDAIGGVMSFQTLTPQLTVNAKPSIHGKFVSRISSANRELTKHFQFMQSGKKWAAVTSLTHSRFRDLKMGRFGPDDYLRTFFVQIQEGLDRVVENPKVRIQNPSGYIQSNIMQKIRFCPNPSWDFQYAFHYSKTSDFARIDRLMEQQADGLPVYAIWNYGPQIWMMNQFSATHLKPTKLWNRMVLRLAQQYFEESRIDRRFMQHRLRTQLEEVSAFSLNWDLEKLMDRHRIYYGIESIFNDVNSFGQAVNVSDGNSIPVADRYPKAIWSSTAGYLSYQFEAFEKVLLQTGARFSVFGLQADFSRNLAFFPFEFNKTALRKSNLTGNLGMVFTPYNQLEIRLNGSTAFRAPNVDDIGKIFDFGAGEVIVPNTGLKSEYAWNGELGISGVIGESLNFDVTGFYTWLDNAMVRRPFQVNGRDSIFYNGQLSKTYALQNAAFGTVYGLHAGLELGLPSGFGWSTRINFQKGTEELDNGEISPSRHAAPAFGDFRLSYRIDKFTMECYAFYALKVRFEKLNPEEKDKLAIYAKDTMGKPFAPAWWTLNYKILYQLRANITLSGGIENILDKRYRPYSSGMVAPGRNFMLSFRASF
jgi:hemoglobin/transferrin/lactoferrin receptor protein